MPYANYINLKDIYKASQCTDENDCILSIKDLENRIKIAYKMGYYPHRAVYQRLNSLTKKMNKFINN